jgi:sugar phosphate isomerase/epimerase
VTRRRGLSRRTLLGILAVAPWASARGASGDIPVGLELFSVRHALEKDPQGTLRAVASMGYSCVEFFSPYHDWSESQTREMRKLLDELGMRCYSTHNDTAFLAPAEIDRTRDRNLILGTRYVVHADSDNPPLRLDGWKQVAARVNEAAERLAPAGLRMGYHNEQVEFVPLEGRRPIEIVAEETLPSVMLQLDVGTCLEAGSDPAAWIRANPGRSHSLHCKDWSPDKAKGYQVLLGEGVGDWKNIFAAAETAGGVEYYLIEQEGSRFPELETARKCLRLYRKMRNESPGSVP